KHGVDHAVAPCAGAEVQAAGHAFLAEPDASEGVLFGEIVDLRARLEPMRGRVREQVPDQLTLGFGAEPSASVFREQRDADLVVGSGSEFEWFGFRMDIVRAPGSRPASTSLAPCHQ